MLDIVGVLLSALAGGLIAHGITDVVDFHFTKYEVGFDLCLYCLGRWSAMIAASLVALNVGLGVHFITAAFCSLTVVYLLERLE